LAKEVERLHGLIRECRLADSYAARTGDERRWDRAFTALCDVLQPPASAIEARSDATPKSGAAEGESAVAESETPNG
jgi:hypothetical protein